MKINELGNFRYSATGLQNGGFAYPVCANLASLTVTMSATYEQLIEFHTNRIQRESTSENPEQIVRNHLTALRGFIDSAGKSTGSPIGDEMASEFGPAVRSHLARMNVSERSASDRRSLLNAWKTSFALMGAAPEVTVRGRERRRANSAPINANPFERGLKAALRNAGIAPKRAAILAGISTSAIGRWTRGALPNIRSADTFTKLEAVLKLPSGHLSQLLNETQGTLAPVHRNEYREQLKQRNQNTYFLKESDLTDEFRREWRALLEYKTSTLLTDTTDRKRGHTNWTTSVLKNTQASIETITSIGGRDVPSARAYWPRVCSFLGYLQLPKSHGGYGLKPTDAQTLAWFCIPEALNGYLTFLTERSGGLRHTGHAVFCGFVAALTNSQRGFLARSPELVDRLPTDAVRGRSWPDLCRAAIQTALFWKASSTDVSRNPVSPIQSLLDQEEPLLDIFKAMTKLRDRAVHAPAGSVAEALARRDEVLLGLLASNPLRKKNIIELTYRADNSGNIYCTAAGEWRIRLKSSAFKNGKRRRHDASRSRPYDVRVASWLDELISDYVKYFRPVLATEDVDNFFLTKNGNPLYDLSGVVLRLTRELIPGSGGFGPHAFRHLVATDWLNRNPNDFLTVAELLNDSLAVVMSTYAHLRRDHAFKRHASQLADLLPDHLRRSSSRP